MQLEKVKKNTTLSEKAYQVVRDAIVTNRLTPGELLTEEQLSEMLNISRTPVRAAIRKLVDEGLLITQGKGVLVSTLTESDIDNIAAIRLAVEPLAIDQLAGKITPEMLRELREIAEYQRNITLSKLSSSEEYLSYIDADYRFHVMLAKCTGNRFLQDIVERINTHSCRGHILSSSLLSDAHKQAAEEHCTVVDCLERGDCTAARRAMENHIAAVRRRFLEEKRVCAARTDTVQSNAETE